jgi:hypothetical protein
MMNVPLRVQFHIFATLRSREDRAWEYNPRDRILIMDLHKLFVPIDYDNEKQMSNILAHIHLGVVWSNFCPSTPGSTRWLCLKAQMLLVKEKYKCIFRC